jgi:hypothetical protein
MILHAACLTACFTFFAVTAPGWTSPLLRQGSQINLAPNQPITVVLTPGEEKTFSLHLKKDDVAEISWLPGEQWNVSFALYDPSGRDLIKDGPDVTDSFPFVVPIDGDYRLAILMKTATDSVKAAAVEKITLRYSNRLDLPTRNTRRDLRRINGYDVKILKSEGENPRSFLLIERNGRLKKVYKGDGSFAAGFSFADDLSNADSPEARRSASLIRSTRDKTGDGNPDVEIGYYSGGAHCCFETFFFELGVTVESRPPISTDNAELIATGRNAKGGLRFKTFDDTFAYWNTSFAESPMPELILDFSKGSWRPNFALMKKPAPSLVELKEMATAARKELSVEPYRGVDNGGIEPVFWGVMLDLIYSGHEDLAWQYFDMVWPTQKEGKELFINDFRGRLTESPFWQMIFGKQQAR